MKSLIFFYTLFARVALAQRVSKHLVLSAILIIMVSVIDTNAATSAVNPVLPPVALCKNITVRLGASGSVTITGSDVNAGSYDPDGVITRLVVAPSTFSCAQRGPNTVVLTVTDDEGLSSTCSATVNVEDRIPPVMNCRNHTVYLDATGNGTITAADLNNGSADNCPGGLFLYISRTSFSCQDIGSPVPVTLTGTDASGNSASCTSQITVLDTVAPVINVKPFNVVLGSSGTASIIPSDVDNGTFDNCGGVTLSVSPYSFGCSDLGEVIVTLTALDSHGNSSSRNVTINVSSTVRITNMTLNSCGLVPALSLFAAEPEGGDGVYSYLWKSVNPAITPFMIIIGVPPSLLLSNTSTLETPFYNSAIPIGFHDIRLIITDGNGCADSSEIRINNTGAVFNNQTLMNSEACEGETDIYSVEYYPGATYSWSVTNGTILNSDRDTSSISVMWNPGAISGSVLTTVLKPNTLFPGGQCEYSVLNSVTITAIPIPSFTVVATTACSDAINTYSLTGSYAYHNWTVTGGVITAGGRISDNFVTVWWGSGPTGSIWVSAGNNSLCTGSAVLNLTVSNLSGTISSRTDITCNGGSDGSVTVAAVPGTGQGPYSFSLDGGDFRASGTFTGISLGNHVVTIRDALACTFDLPFIISQPPPVSGSVAALADVSCFGGTNGSVTITASGGVQPYQYRLNTGAFQNSNVFSGLSAGSYIITIRDNNGCTGSVPATIIQPSAPLNGSASVTNVSCFGGSTGRIDITVTGGTQPYAFLWSNGAAVEDLANIPAGAYSVVITDANMCTVTVPATVSQPAAAVSGTASVTNVLCFGGTNGAVNLSAGGGTFPYTFAWNNGAVTEDIQNLPAGSYSVVITDANGCTATVSATVAGPAAPVGGSVTSQNNVSCFGGNNGSVSVAGTGGTAPYEYQLGTGLFQLSGTFGSLARGVYSITIRDANLCTFVLSVTITEPSAPLTGSIVSATDVLCFGGASGSVTVTGAGGTPPYMYNIDAGAFGNSGVFGSLTAGLHTVIVRDINLCTFSLPVTILQPVLPVGGSILSQTDAGCFGESTGSVTVAGSGGVPPYTYSINGVSFQTSGLFENLGEGEYNITVRDFNLCQHIVPVSISQPDSPLSVTTSHTNVPCYGGTTGSATAIPEGGTEPYTYSWNTVPVQTGISATGLAAGSYTVTVTDDNGCVASAIAAISQPSAALTASLAVSNISCNGGSDGIINLTVSNGTLPMAFLWSNGATTEDISGLTAGTYSVSVTDANGCTANASGTVSEPSVLTGSIAVTNVVCSGQNTGSCNLTVSGGTMPYSYLWSNGATTQDISNLTAGTYSVRVIDSRGCTINVSAVISQPAAALSGSITSQTNVTVYGGNDGSVTVSGSGGTPPYQYSINGVSYQPTGTFGSLTAGSYSVTVRDAAMCIYNVRVTISQPWIELTANIISQTDVSCPGAGDGSVTVAGWGGTQPYAYSIDGGTFQLSGTFSSLSAGTFTVTVRDQELDLYDISVTIIESDALDVAVSGIDVQCYGGSTGSVTATVTGGTAPYTYEWNSVPAQFTPTATGLPAGTWRVTVTDSNGCSSSNSVTIAQPATDMSVAITPVNVLCSGGASGSATAVVTGGLAPFTYIWNTTPLQTKETATDLSAGTYTVTVSDSYGCIRSGSVTLSEPESLSVESSTTSASCPDSNDGSISLAISGGTAPYSVIWSDGITTQNRERVLPGTYSAVVTDNNNCAASLEADVDFTWTFSCVVIPQLITPNNDGINDEWTIRNIDLYPNAEVRIFNRWGQLVYSTKNLSDNPWDGRLNGKLVPTDSYHYILHLNDGSAPKSGVISVIR